MTITDTMSRDHRHCDELFAEVESRVAAQEWEQARELLTRFLEAMEHHLGHEENCLFPALEQHIGGPVGPVRVMLMEHQQMRQLFDEMRAAVAQKQADEYLGLSETLLMIMQQHNLKEEQILYHMMDNAIGNEADSLMSDFAKAA
jgi:iron-sulfur cluster repair protein YtfE (RIC family)